MAVIAVEHLVKDYGHGATNEQFTSFFTEDAMAQLNTMGSGINEEMMNQKLSAAEFASITLLVPPVGLKHME